MLWSKDVMDKIKDNVAKFLTFYHEFRIPQNPFFLNESVENTTLFLTSPSRMGNHALISMLDSHPQLPKVPGEDSFLTWSFVKANYDVSSFIGAVRDVNYIEKLSSDSGLNSKWFEHKKIFNSGVCPEIYNGVQYNYNDDVNSSLHRIPGIDSFVDFQGVTLDVNYEQYHAVLLENQNLIEASSSFMEIFNIYLKAFYSLLNNKNEAYSFGSVYACSGMRVQSLWALKHNKNMKMIVSIRRFESYAVSMIKSFYKTSELREEYLKEAWEQWFHKVIDYLYLKLHYPSQVLLVDFDDIINDSTFVAKHISKFLDIEFHSSMLKATINGMSVKGNSSESRKNEESGIFYKSTKKELSPEHVPEDYHAIWEIFTHLKYDGLSLNE